MAAAAVDNHNAASSCQDDPNFATICSFIDKFGESCNLGDLPFDYLQEMLENSTEIAPKLAQIHIQLLRRVYKTVAVDKWEKQLAKFGHSYNSQDGWEIERFGYKKAKIQTKLRLLKTLLEAQFDYNVKFKNEVNKLPAEDLRRQPIGRDSEGQLYWYQVDPDANLRIYREDIDDETWEVVASTREEMVKLIEDLSSGVVKKNSILEEENGDGELSPREILLDTGKVADDQNVDDEDDNNEDEDDEDAMQIDESYDASREENTEPESANEKVVKTLPSESQSDDAKVVPDVTKPDTEASEPSTKSDNEKSEEEIASSCEMSQLISNPSEVKQETQPAPELTDPANAPPQANNEHLNEQNSHPMNNGTDAPNGNSDHLVKSESFNLNVPNDNVQIQTATASASNSKDPVFTPPISKATCQDPLNNDIWNPAVHQSSKLYVDNQKHLSSTEAKNSSKYQQPQRLSPIQRQQSSKWDKPAEFKPEPSPLENLKMFTQKMSAKPNTLSENLRKLTAELPEEMDEAGFHPKETDNGEKFVKPESSVSPSKRSDHSKSRMLESAKVPHQGKSRSKELPVPVLQKERFSAPESQDRGGNTPLSQQVEKNAPVKEDIHPPVATELCTPVTEETEHKVLPCQAPAVEILSEKTDQKISPEAPSVVLKVSVEDTATAGLPIGDEDKQTIKPVIDSTTTTETSESLNKISSAPEPIFASTQHEQPSTIPTPGTGTSVSESVAPQGNGCTVKDSGPASSMMPSSAELEKESSASEINDTEGNIESTKSTSESASDVQLKDTEMPTPGSELSTQPDCFEEKSQSQGDIIAASAIPSSVGTTDVTPENITAHDPAPTETIVKDISSVQEELSILPTQAPDNKPVEEVSSTPVQEQSGQEKSTDKIDKSKPLTEVVEPPITKSTAWLVGYEDSSNDETVEETDAKKEDSISNQSQEIPRSLDVLVEDSLTKRKSDPAMGTDTCSPKKKSRIDDGSLNSESVNPIIGEAIEEETMIITGEGSGAELQGGNRRRSSEIVSDEQQGSEESPKKSKNAGRQVKSEGAQKKTPAPRRKSFGNELNDLTPTERSVTELNGSSGTERPMRQSRRIAQLREKEEAERRRQEEEHLAQLKQAQMQKQERQQELEAKKKKKSDGNEKAKSTKSKGKQASKSKTQEYLPSPSVSASESDNDEAYELPKGKGKHKRRGKKNEAQKFKKGLKPWLHSSSDEDEAIEEEEEEVHEEEEEIHFDKSDHEFSPESDLGEDDDVCPSRHARTAKLGPDAEDKYATTVCDKCTKGDHPEWILLCDACDKGWHASCIRPQLWVIPEGEWFCPPCQHKKLVEKLGESLIEFDKLLKKRENDDLRRQRLTYVGISMENILPPDKTEKANESKHRSSKHSRRRILSDEEDSENLNEFINDNDDDGSSGSKLVSSDESDDEPMYKLRARRATKAFNFKEYDDMINSALKDDEFEDYDEASDIKEENEVEKAETEITEDGRSPAKMEVEKAGEETAPTEKDEEEILDEKERKYQELEKATQRKTRRRLNDLDATSEDDSDEDFKDSNGDDDEDEEEVPEDDSDWSGDRDADESDESIGRLRRQAKKERKYGRRETYLEVGSVRRSTRRVKPKYQYDESDQEDDDNDAPEPWEENSEESETNSESDDATWGKKKNKKKAAPPPRSSRSAMRNFVLIPESTKTKSPAKKKKKKPAGSDDEDRPWNRGGGKAKKVAEESTQQRTTRGKKINFKDILDSGESDDDGNIRPKRRRVVAPDSDDSEGPSSSKKMVAELNNAKSLAAATEKERQEQPKEKKDKPSPAPPTILATELQMPSNGAGNNAPPIIPMIPEIPKPTLEAELKPIPAPPYPPVRNQLREVLKRNSEAASKTPVSQPSSTSLLMSEILATPSIRTPSPVTGKKSAPSPMGTPTTLPSGAPPVSVPQPMHRGISPQHAPPSMPSDISRAMDPSFMQRAQAMRAFHPAWTRSPMPPPYGNHTPGGPSPSPPTSTVGKPPPLSSLPFMSQSPMRSPYATPSLGIPSPNPPPLQSFHQFKRDVGLPMYRLPPNLSGLPPQSAGLLPQMHPGLGHPNPHLEQFYGAHRSPFGIPGYGIPPHSQSQPMFSAPQHYDYRGEGSFKNEIMGPGAHGPATPGHGQMKDDMNPGQPGDGEFGGLVSYFSSQRGDDDLDT